MTYRLSFANLNLLKGNIVEIIVDAGIEFSLEMMEEYERFLAYHFNHEFCVLVNRVNEYSYSYEVQLSIASNEKLKAIAVVNYSQQSKESTNKMNKLRSIDGWNLNAFSGEAMGREKALSWLEKESEGIKIT